MQKTYAVLLPPPGAGVTLVPGAAVALVPGAAVLPGAEVEEPVLPAAELTELLPALPPARQEVSAKSNINKEIKITRLCKRTAGGNGESSTLLSETGVVTDSQAKAKTCTELVAMIFSYMH